MTFCSCARGHLMHQSLYITSYLVTNKILEQEAIKKQLEKIQLEKVNDTQAMQQKHE